MPVLVVFLGLMSFVYREYTVKQDMMALTRQRAFSHALHADCRGTGNFGNGIPGVQEAVESPLTWVVLPILPAVKYGLDASVTTNDDAAVATAVAGGHSATIKSLSYTYCNPKSWSEVWRDMVNATLDRLHQLVRGAGSFLGQASSGSFTPPDILDSNGNPIPLPAGP